MRARVGIELSPVACRLVELDGPPIEPGRPPATRVRAYAVLPRSGLETERRLVALGRRSAAVVLWGVRSDHRHVVVSSGSYESMRTEALESARSAGVDTRGAIADIATASTAIKGADRQPVVLALASAEDVSAAVQPFRDAGVHIRSVITPADALLGLARSRRAFAVPGGIEAYVALDETVTCVALVRDGSLLSARELPWGYADGPAKPAASAVAEIRRRDDLAARLVDELTELLTTVGVDGSAVAQVSVCGGLPDLRTMTVSLMERLDVEVEALDSLFGIDAERLPEPAAEFREQASTLRLAWAAAADWRGPINLLRHRRRRNQRVVLARAAVVAGVAAGLGIGLAIQQSAWWQATPPQVASTTPAAAPPVTSPAAARSTATSPPATPAVPAPAARTPGPPTPAPASAPPAIAATPRPSDAPATAQPPTLSTPVLPASRGTSPATTNAPRPPARQSAPATPLPVAPSIAPPARQQPAPPAAVSVAPPAAAATPAVRRPAAPAPLPSTVTTPPRIGADRAASTITAASQPATRRVEESPVPFDAVLGTILYSPDRKLAIVNGRIVGLGDAVDGARIVEITADAVLLRDAQGRLRHLTLGRVGSGIAP